MLCVNFNIHAKLLVQNLSTNLRYQGVTIYSEKYLCVIISYYNTDLAKCYKDIKHGTELLLNFKGPQHFDVYYTVLFYDLITLLFSVVKVLLQALVSQTYISFLFLKENKVSDYI